MNKQELLDVLEKNYVQMFFRFSIKNVNNYNEAEELAQEICYQCVLAIDKGNIRDNLNAFLWSIAHNTYKNWCRKKSRIILPYDDMDSYSNLVIEQSMIQDVIKDEENSWIRKELSKLCGYYRETLVLYYYEELSIHQIGLKLNLTDEMVKFYLRDGKKKLKEVSTMNVGNKSFKPSSFSIYKAAIDFSKVNINEVYKRRLPGQISLYCHEVPRTIRDISNELGVAAVYIEDEVKLLMEAGVMIKVDRNKYRTNFHILTEEMVKQVKEQFKTLYSLYLPAILSVYERELSNIKNCDIFHHIVEDNRYRWFFANNVLDFSFDGEFTSDGNYPVQSNEFPSILSCGSKAFIFAEEATSSVWAAGQTPTELSDCVVWAKDIIVLGEYHHQRELRDTKKAQALYDIYCDKIREEDALLYAELIKEGYITKVDGKLYCDVMVSNKKSREKFREINNELREVLTPLCNEVAKNVRKIVKSTIPEQLSEYVNGFTTTWLSFYAGVSLYESLYEAGFLLLPNKDDMTPIACYIYER